MYFCIIKKSRRLLTLKSGMTASHAWNNMQSDVPLSHRLHPFPHTNYESTL